MAGTVLDIYVENSQGNRKIQLLGDGAVLYSETLGELDNNRSNYLSCYYLYDTSDKRISVTLERDIQEVHHFGGRIFSLHF